RWSSTRPRTGCTRSRPSWSRPWPDSAGRPRIRRERAPAGPGAGLGFPLSDRRRLSILATATTPESQAAPPVWYSLSGEDVAAKLGVDVRTGLSTSEAESRRAQYGPNKFAEA